MRSRVRVLESEIGRERARVAVLADKSTTDDTLIEALQASWAYAHACACIHKR